jgi:hypothetical protein
VRVLAILAVLVSGAAAASCARTRPALAVEPTGGAPLPTAASLPGAGAPPYADPDTPSLPREVWDVAGPRPWSVIVVHHSATHEGGAARFDAMHRARGWDGVGYDFVLGNGTETPDGSIETTFRWKEQRDGAHVKGWNDVAIGICLVGDFEEKDPTASQLDVLARLVRHLRRRFRIPPERVVGHGTLGTTACPGRRLDLAAVRAASDPAAAGAPP